MKRIMLLVLTLMVCISMTAAASKATDIEQNPVSIRNNVGPFNLMAEVLCPNDILLVWENPAYLNQPMGYRVYCNNTIALYVTGAGVSDCLLEDACDGCHQLYVVACYDTGCESLPSNIVEITITENSDAFQIVKPMQLKVYPNPSRGNVHVLFSGDKHNNFVGIKVYSALGELVKQSDAKKDNPWLWDGRDIAGKRVGQGIYFVKVITSQGSLTQKVVLLK